MDLIKQKYPIGKFERPEVYSPEIIANYKSIIAGFPALLRDAVSQLNNEQLDTEYRPGGWTIRQVVNHCADSHMNSLTRFKLTLTEDKPVIKTYLEALWAELPDSTNIPVEPALKMIEGIHERWSVLLQSLSAQQMQRSFVHPEHGKEFSLNEILGIYAWHCQHHLAHINNLKELKGWK